MKTKTYTFLLMAAFVLALALSGCIKKKQPPHITFSKVASIVPQDIFEAMRGSVSPDGSRVVYSVYRAGLESLNLVLLDLKSGEKKMLTTGKGFRRSPDWSPDGKQLIYAASGQEKTGLWILDLTSGNERQLLPDSISGIAFAPQWTRQGKVVFSCRTNPASIWSVNPDGSQLQQIEGAEGEFAALSNDEKFLVSFRKDSGNFYLELYDFQTGLSKILLKDFITIGEHPVWGDDNIIYFVAAMGTDPQLHAWSFSISDKTLMRIDSLDHEALRISMLNGNQIALVSIQPEVTVGTLPIEGGELSFVLQDARSQFFLPSWLPGGRGLVFTSGPWRHSDMMVRRNIPWDIGTVEFDKQGQPNIILAKDNEDYGPVYSPDGAWLAFHAHFDNTDDIYITRASLTDGIIKLSDGGIYETGGPDWSPDGNAVVYAAHQQDAPYSRAFIAAFDPATGKPYNVPNEVPLDDFEGSVFSPRFSRDGKKIAFTGSMADGTSGVYTVALTGGKPFCASKYQSGENYSGPEWSRDGNSLFFSSNYGGDRYRLMKVSAGGGEALVVYEGERSVLHPRISPDGKQLAVTIWNNKTNIWIQQ